MRRAQTPLCKSMVQLHSRPTDDEELYQNLTAVYDCLGPLDHLMISSDHPLQKIKDKQDLVKRLMNKSNKSSLRTSRSTGVIHQRSSIVNQAGSLEHSNLESNHYCCTNISTGLSEIIHTGSHNGSHILSSNNTSNDFNLSHLSQPGNLSHFGSLTNQLSSSQLAVQKCRSCSNYSTGNFTNSTLTCTCSSMKSTEPIYMLPSLKEQTEALTLEYPSNVVAINTDQVQFTRMSSFRRSLIHVGIL